MFTARLKRRPFKMSGASQFAGLEGESRPSLDQTAEGGCPHMSMIVSTILCMMPQPLNLGAVVPVRL